ncbi:MAG: hypothetical protein KIS66_05770 [Fimbriimonadaceae bacterium]|nr:hypothetical protein [Fimbriimonadaceae bacterium]
MPDSHEVESDRPVPGREPADTHPEAYRRYIARLRTMTPAERVARVFAMRRFAADLREGANRAR